MKKIVYLLCWLGAVAARAAIITWTNSSGGDWNTALNWNPPQVPGAGDNAYLTNNGAYTVTLSANAAVNSLTLGGASGTQTLNTSGQNLTLNTNSVIATNGILVLNGTLGGNGSVAVLGELNWTGGQVNPGSVVTVATNGLLLMAGPSAPPSYFDGILTNAGTVRLTAGEFQMSGDGSTGGLLVNLPGGLVDITADIPIQNTTSSELVLNKGTLRKSGGTGTTVIYPLLENPGKLDVQTGTVSVNGGGGSGNGQFIAEAGATLMFSSGSYEVDSALSGAGTNVLYSGTFILKGAINSSNTILENGASLLASNAVINSSLTWTYGFVNPGSVLTVATNGLLLYAGYFATYPSFFQGILTNAGTVRMANGIIELGGNGSTSGLLVNLPGALVDMTADTSIATNTGSELVLNEGTLRKSGGTGTNYIYPGLRNPGKLDAQTGTISVSGNCNLAGGTLNFGINSLANYGRINLAGTAALTGAVSMNLNNAYAPSVGSAFGVLTYGAETGVFTSLLLPAGYNWTTNYGPTTFTIENSNNVALPQTDQLQIRMIGLGTISPNYSNALLQIGQTYSMTATPQAGFTFTDWTIATNWIGGQMTNHATVQFTMASNLTLTVAFADPTPPTLSITNVPAGLSVSNAAFTVRGVAGDNWQVANVFYSLNGAGWSNAASGNNWSNWTAAVTLAAGSNTFAAYAVDPGGQASITTNASLFFLVTNQLHIRTLGLGTVSPNDSNAWLQIGRYYSITSAPASGFVFSNWTLATNWMGGLVKTGTNLQFMMESNLTLQAAFMETSLPALTITAPANLQKMTNALATVTGTASDKWGVSEVWCQANHGVWTAAETTNGWTNWTTLIKLISGTNSISAQAMNLGGNYSPTGSVSVISSNTFLLQLLFTNAIPLKTNGLVFSLEVSKGLDGHIEYSTNLAGWATLTNFVGTNSPLTFRDPAATNSSHRFYRAVIP